MEKKKLIISLLTLAFLFTGIAIRLIYNLVSVGMLFGFLAVVFAMMLCLGRRESLIEDDDEDGMV